MRKSPSSVIVQTGGIGFEVLISARTFEKIPQVGSGIELDIHTLVREDEIRLIGFLDQEDKELFLKLISVSGISVKIALSALSIYDSPGLTGMILGRETDLIRRIPGIGKKLAERVILELYDRLKEEEGYGGRMEVFMPGDERINEVKQALNTLGYNTGEINRAISKISIDEIADKKVEDILKIVLREV
ncbi:MAG: Holliday junction branch migration protein RuvA [Actinobacteria bacterium]|nr:Holliday junction branch migration protein RuvA [Actinomycetota bacterium]